MSSGGYSKCCLTAFQWRGKAEGTESTLAGRKAYVTGPADSDIAILFIHDILGWTFNNSRLLCDYYAKETGAKVYMPDFFDGWTVDFDLVLSNQFEKVDLKSFSEANTKDKRRPQIIEAARAIRKNGAQKVGTIGFCFGGWAVFNLGAKELNPAGNLLVDCIATAHPTFLTNEEMLNLGVPAQIQAPEHDPAFSPESKEFANKNIPTLGVPYEYLYFPGVVHGFATKGDYDDPVSKAAMARSMQAAVSWFRTWLKTE